MPYTYILTLAHSPAFLTLVFTFANSVHSPTSSWDMDTVYREIYPSCGHFNNDDMLDYFGLYLALFYSGPTEMTGCDMFLIL